MKNDVISCQKIFFLYNYAVAPLVGAWIEIKIVKIPQKWELVAPLVGAWIEMYELNFAFTKLLSLPLWERGLKFHLLLQLTRDI